MLNGFIDVKNNSQLIAEEKAAVQQESELRQRQQYVKMLAHHIRAAWESAASAKLPVEQALIANLMQRNGLYDAATMHDIRQYGGSAIYMLLTDEKCTAAEAWIEDILFPPGEMPWGVKSTPVPEVTPEQIDAIRQTVEQEAIQNIQLGISVTPQQMMENAKSLLFKVQERMKELARDAAVKSEEYIKDKVVESNWSEELKKYISDFVTFKASFLGGPFIKYEDALEWGENFEPIIAKKQKVFWECFSPFDCYPAASSREVDDGDFIVKYKLTRKQLMGYSEEEGFDPATIKHVLAQYPTGFREFAFTGVESQRRDLENRTKEPYDPNGKYDAIRYWGSVQGIMLLEHGMSPAQVPDPWAEYEVEAWMIGNYIIKAILNPDILGRRPIFKSSYRKRNGSFWGDGLPDLIKDLQDMCNKAARHIANNMAIGSGPQVGIDVGMIEPGTDVKKIFPWRVWTFNMKDASTARPPVWFFQPNIITDQLLKVYEFFAVQADNKAGIPRYAYGGQEQTGGALGTASGFSMMMNNASKAIKKIVGNIDMDVIVKSINRLIAWLMIYDKNPILFQGDIQIMAKGSTSLVVKEQVQVRRNEFFQVLLHPAVLNIIGPLGLSEVLREMMKGLDFNTDRVVPAADEMQRLAAIQQKIAMMGGGSPGGGGGSQPPQKGVQTDAAGNKAGGADANLVRKAA